MWGKTTYYIYSIRCKANDKRYVGRTVHINTRPKNHFSLLRNGKHPVEDFQEDFGKYGEDGFEWEVLDSAESLGTSRDAEAYWMGFFNSHKRESGYNYKDRKARTINKTKE